jgi:23S rRNA pseudouridine1911/1915/1917 synthase
MEKRGIWLEYQTPGRWSGKTVEDILKGPMHLSGRMIQKLTRSNGILINQKKAHLARVVKAGDKIRAAVFLPEDYGVDPLDIAFDIVYEDDHVLVVNKPAGLSVHPTEPGQTATLANGIAFYYQQNGIKAKVRHVHRLDKDTSGLLIVAKNAFVHGLLDDALRKRLIRREYVAVVHGRIQMAKGTIDQPIGRDRHHPTRRRVSPSGEPARTHYEVIEYFSDASYVKLWLETGRTHQIRVHMSFLGHPLIGDTLYGGERTNIDRQALHAKTISFPHPLTNELITLAAPLPDDMKNLLTFLQTTSHERR